MLFVLFTRLLYGVQVGSLKSMLYKLKDLSSYNISSDFKFCTLKNYFSCKFVMKPNHLIMTDKIIKIKWLFTVLILMVCSLTFIK